MYRNRLCSALGLSIFLRPGPMSGLAGRGIVPGDFDNDCDCLVLCSVVR